VGDEKAGEEEAEGQLKRDCIDQSGSRRCSDGRDRIVNDCSVSQFDSSFAVAWGDMWRTERPQYVKRQSLRQN